MALARVPERAWPRLEQGCMYGGMNGANSDNAISIQTMVTQTMVTQKMVGRNMVSRNMVTPKLEPGYS